MIKLSDKTKKTLNMIGGIFSYILIGFTVVILLITIITIAPSNRNESEKFLFGYKFYVVTSDSMSKTDFDAGDLICVKKIDPDDLEVGDIISYVSEYAGNYGSIVTHKIREKNEISECILRVENNEIKNYCVFSGTKDNRLIQMGIENLLDGDFLEKSMDYAFKNLNAHTITIFSDGDNSNLEKKGFESLGKENGITTYVKEKEMNIEIEKVR